MKYTLIIEWNSSKLRCCQSWKPLSLLYRGIGNSFPHNSIRFDLFQLNSIQIKSNQIKLHSIEFNSDQFEFDSIQFDSILFRFNSIWLYSNQYNSIQFNPIRFNSIHFDSIWYAIQFDSIEFLITRNRRRLVFYIYSKAVTEVSNQPPIETSFRVLLLIKANPNCYNV